MKFNNDCLCCNIQQINKISNIIPMDNELKENVTRDVLEYLSNVSYDLTNPEIMKGSFEIITKAIGNDNPYKEVKEHFNEVMLEIYHVLHDDLLYDEHRFSKALHFAIDGNIIDFGASHEFSKEALIDKLENSNFDDLIIDHKDLLYSKLKYASKLLYIGDNCGEIVLDKLFMKCLKKEFPQLEVVFSVRGKSILNDVTIEDAIQVDMEETAQVIDDGNGTPGTVLESSGQFFKKTFEEADVVIAKGQGNFEGLCDVDKKNLFFLFMAKCDLVSKSIDVATMSKVCLQNK